MNAKRCEWCLRIATLRLRETRNPDVLRMTDVDGVRVVFEGQREGPSHRELFLCGACAATRIPDVAKPMIESAAEQRRLSFTADALLLGEDVQLVFEAARYGGDRSSGDRHLVWLSATKDGLVAATDNGRVAVSVRATRGYQWKEDSHMILRRSDVVRPLRLLGAQQVTWETSPAEVRISDGIDGQVRFTLPRRAVEAALPSIAEDLTPPVRVRREPLLRVLEHVTYALGDEPYKPTFMYAALRVHDRSVRAVAGDGGRFSAFEIEGEGLVETDTARTCLIWGKHCPCLTRLLTASNSDWVAIRQSTAEPAQTVINIDAYELLLHGHRLDIDWPDENKFLGRVSELRYSVPREALFAAARAATVRGAGAALVTLTFDPANGIVRLKGFNNCPDGVAELSVPLSDARGGPLSFTVKSDYLTDLKLGDGDHVQLEFVDASKPVVIRFFANPTVGDGPFSRVSGTNGWSERHSMIVGGVRETRSEQQSVSQP